MAAMHWTSLLLVAATATASAAPAGPSTAPAVATTAPAIGKGPIWQPFLKNRPSQGTVKWQPYTLHLARLAVAGATTLWFVSDAFIWRYDVKTRQIQSWSALDGLPMGSWGGERSHESPVDADGNGGCVVLLGGPMIHRWTPARGWEPLPPLADHGGPHDLRLCGAGVLYAMTGEWASGREPLTIIWRLWGGRWEEVTRTGKVGARLFTTAEGGFLVADSTRSYLLDGNGQIRELGNFTKAGGSFSSVAQIGRRVIYSSHANERVEHTLGEQTLKPLNASVAGIDLRSMDVLHKVTGKDGKVRLVAGDGASADFPFDDAYLNRGSKWRDQNGDFWLRDRRWDGKGWSQVAPEGQMSLLYADYPHPRPLCQDVTDPALWREERYASRCEDGVQLLKVRDWQVTVAKSLKPDNWEKGCGAIDVSLYDAKGRHWGDIWCRDGATGEMYGQPVCIWPGGTATKLERGNTPTFISPTGEVWFMGFPAGRYSEATGRIETVKQEVAFEALAFEVAGRKFSVSLDASNGGTYEKVGDEWRLLEAPVGNPGSRGSVSMVCGDRLLQSNLGSGTWEYDIAGKRWILLARWWGLAYFDAKGRRVLDGLILTGDPFEAAKDELAADGRQFDALLKRLDDAKLAVREAATEEMRKDLRRWVLQIAAALGGDDVSLEVRTRLEGLQEHAREKHAYPLDLFTRMHPPMGILSAATKPAN